MLPHFLLTSSIYRGLIRIWPIWRNPHQYTPDHPGVCDDVNLKTLVQTRMGDMNGDDSSCKLFYLDYKSANSQITSNAVTIITLVYKTLYYACYRVCDVTCTTAGGNTQPRWQPTTVTALITDCGNFTLDLKQRGFCASPLFLQTLGP